MRQTALIIFVLCFAPSAFAQDFRATNVLGRRFPAGHNVIELDVPDELDGRRFFIVWVTEGGQQAGVWHVARSGRHCYEVRHRPEWKGQVQAVAITLDGVAGRVRAPTFRDEIDMFLEPERITPGTVNALIGHTLFTWRWEVIVLLIAPGGALLLFLRKKRMAPALVWGFLIAWGVMDLRAVYDHAATVFEAESHHLDAPPLTRARVFADRAGEMIGTATWSHEPLVGVVNSYVRYRLAEHPLVAVDASPPSTFLITQQPKEGQVVYQYANYCLVRRGGP